jgi:hypothetical protein
MRPDRPTHGPILTAILLLQRGEPLPVDLQTHLMTEGIDVAAFTKRHAL